MCALPGISFVTGRAHGSPTKKDGTSSQFVDSSSGIIYFLLITRSHRGKNCGADKSVYNRLIFSGSNWGKVRISHFVTCVHSLGSLSLMQTLSESFSINNEKVTGLSSSCCRLTTMYGTGDTQSFVV